jgi:pilus assembly protein CpaB
MRRYAGVLLLVLAVLMAVVTLYVISRPKPPTSNGQPEKKRPPPTQQVAVVARDLFWGTRLTTEMMRLKPFPQESLPEGYFSDLGRLAGRFLVANLATNEPILASKLAPPGGGLGALTHHEKRAMAVKVNTVVGVAGFIKPGNRVDVLVTLRRSPPVAKMVLENVLVLATGAEIERKGKQRKPSPVKVITLEVTPREAEKLALAANQGELRLALRNLHDANSVLTPGATIPSLLSSYRVPARKRTVKRPKVIEVIKGGKVETLTFK